MAWTNVKKAVVIGGGILLTAGLVTVVIINGNRPYPWQVASINTAILDKVPPQVRIVPSKFTRSGGWVTQNDKVLGICQTVQRILLLAYGENDPARMVALVKLPEENYDFIANLAQNSREALQRALQKKFGLTAMRQTRETDVLRLTLKNVAAEGLKRSRANGGSTRSSRGRFSCVNQPLSVLIPVLERHYEMPIVDATGLSGRFDIKLAWEETSFRTASIQAMNEALLEQLGLALEPGKEEVLMLVVQKPK